MFELKWFYFVFFFFFNAQGESFLVYSDDEKVAGRCVKRSEEIQRLIRKCNIFAWQSAITLFLQSFCPQPVDTAAQKRLHGIECSEDSVFLKNNLRSSLRTKVQLHFARASLHLRKKKRDRWKIDFVAPNQLFPDAFNQIGFVPVA